jgi:cholesterol transport system auxiliary component
MHMLASLELLPSRNRKSDLREVKHSAARRRAPLATVWSLLALLFAATLAAGCGAARPIRYYQLNVPEITPATAAAETYPVTIVLGPLTASHLYREDRIVYGTTAEGMGTYEYQRWAEPPTEMIQAVLLRELRNTHRFRDVYSMKSAVHGDYILRGQLYDFKEISTPNLMARVSFDLELHDTKTGSTVWSTSYRQDEPVGAKDPAAVVAALDKNLESGLRQAASAIDQYFAAHPPAAAQN